MWPRCIARSRGSASPASRPACTRCAMLPGQSEAGAVARAAAHGVAVGELGAYCATGRHDRAALVVGYGTPPEHAFSGAIARLCAALRELLPLARGHLISRVARLSRRLHFVAALRQAKNR